MNFTKTFPVSWRIGQACERTINGGTNTSASADKSYFPCRWEQYHFSTHVFTLILHSIPVFLRAWIMFNFCGCATPSLKVYNSPSRS